MPKNTLEDLGVGTRAWILFPALPQTHCLQWRTSSDGTQGMLLVPRNALQSSLPPLFTVFSQPVQWVQYWPWQSRAHEMGCWCNSSGCVSRVPWNRVLSWCPTDQAHLPFSSFPVSLELTLTIQNISRYKQLWLKKKLIARKVLSSLPANTAPPCTGLLVSGNLSTVRMFKSNVLQNSVLNVTPYCLNRRDRHP